MRHTKMVERPATTEEVTDFISCDFCGRKTGPDGEWAKDYGDFDRTTITIERGYNHGDSGDSETKGVDICPTCFRKKLVPWMREQGVELRVIENKEW